LNESADKKLRRKVWLDFFVRFGAGADYWKGLTAHEAWNGIAWGLIILGIAAWIAFLTWNP
jgi:hypothetical protein